MNVANGVQPANVAGGKYGVANTSGKPSNEVTGKNATVTGTIDTTTGSNIVATESKTVTDTLTKNVADSLATEPVIKSKPMDFAKIADSLNKLYGREDEKAKTVKDTVAYKKFHLYAFGAATRYKLPENGNYIDPSLSSKNSDSKVSVPFGGYLGYSLSRRCILRAGIILTRFQQTSRDVSIGNTSVTHAPSDDFPDGFTEIQGPENFNGVSYKDGVNNAFLQEVLSNASNDAGRVAVVDIYSRTEFMEIPVELLFQVYDSKIGADLLCGFSMRTLTSSEVYAENEGGRIYMGSISNAEKKMKGYAATFGVNLNYDFTSNLQFNIEPVVRYYFQTQGFGESYTLGIQAGIQYNFDLFRTKK
ncbi:MAG: hypothetical protein EOO20_18845 [Chryseobacterium sp.]|nr:MAG: hypothetical protein EOO20_18845 [Chryseobacterium sp.]